MRKQDCFRLIEIAVLSLLAAPPLFAAAGPAREAGLERAHALAANAYSANQNLPAGAPVYRVGPDCAYTTIQEAVGTIPINGEGTIRIRAGTFNENVFIGNKDVEMIGGHADCTTTTATDFTTIDGSGTGEPAVRFLVSAGAVSTRDLRLNRMIVSGGTGTSLYPGGGVSVWALSEDAEANLFLDRSSIKNNTTGFHGGGLALVGPGNGTVILQNESSISGNTVTGDAPRGGGLFCENGYTILMTGGSIGHNVAGTSGGNVSRGGGIYLDGCNMAWFSDEEPEPDGTLGLAYNMLSFNHVQGLGGGLYATGGAQVTLSGSHFVPFGEPESSRPLHIYRNQSSNGGGAAVEAAGAGTRVTLDRAWIHDNTASGGNGIIRALSGAQITLERAGPVCHHPRACSRVFDNQVTGGTGTFMSFHETSEIRLRKTIISGNSASDAGFQTDLFNHQIGGAIVVEDSLIFGNTSTNGFFASSATPPTLHLYRSTIANNQFGGVVFRLGNTTQLRLWDSIVYEPGTSMASNSADAELQVDCVIWHNDQLGGERTQIADPLFVNPSAGLFYLQPGSPAINYCNVPPPAPGVDLDWNPRGICHSTNESCGINVYDLGAYELQLGIFSDRFEAP